MASKFKKRKSELNKKRLYSLILIFLMISSVLAFVVIYGSGSGGTNSYNGYDLYPSPNGYSLLIPEFDMEIYNHPSTLGFSQYGFNDSNIVRDRIKTANTIALSSSFNGTDRAFTDEFKFFFDTRTDLFEGQLISTGYFDAAPELNCDSQHDLIIMLNQKNYTSVELNNNCLTLNYLGIYEANQMIETLLLYRVGVIE